MKTREDGKNIVHLAAAYCDATLFDMLLPFRLPGITAEDSDADGKTACDLFQQRHDNEPAPKCSSEEYV